MATQLSAKRAKMLQKVLENNLNELNMDILKKKKKKRQEAKTGSYGAQSWCDGDRCTGG